MKSLFFISIVLLFLTNISAQGTEKVKEEVWQKELQYWQYVKNNDSCWLSYTMARQLYWIS
jgi:hypothetical protein